MRKLRQICKVCLALALILMSVTPMKAEARYTYTIRIYSGQQGTIGGGEVVVYSGLDYGSRVNFNLRDVVLNDNSKYYVKGIRQSGRDNNTVGTTSFQVTEDRDYVVAYGLLTDAVAYTINYVDAAGSALAPSETYYGNVGDKPVIAYLYIEGYRPEAYNLTGTLSENAAENVFDFVYTPIGTGTIPVIPGAPIGGGTTPGDSGVPIGGGTTPGDSGVLGDPGSPEDQEIPDHQIPEGNTGQPDEYVDIDENETPQGMWNNLVDIFGDAFPVGIPPWMKLGMALLIVALVGGGIRYKMKSRKGRKA